MKSALLPVIRRTGLVVPTRRSISSFLRSLFPCTTNNPLLESFQPNNEDASYSAPPKLPDFSIMQTYHMDVTLEHVKEQQTKTIEQLRAHLDDRQEKSIAPPATSSDNDDSAAVLRSLEELITLINTAQEPNYTLRQLSSILWLLSGDESAQWKEEAAKATALESWNDDAKLSARIHAELQKLLSSIAKDNVRGNDDLQWAANNLVQKYESSKAGEHLESAQDREKYSLLTEALQPIDERLLETSTKSVAASTFTPQVLSDMYNSIGIRTEQAKLLGYTHFADYVFRNTNVANVDEIRQLHVDIAERIVPQIRSEYGVKKSADELALDAYLSDKKNDNASTRSGADSTSEERRRNDEQSMLRLEQHVTLDGALQFIFRVSQDLFGINIIQQPYAKAWNTDVRLFHVYDSVNSSNTYLGSFYLDPFQRRDKLARSATMPLFPRGKNRSVACVMALEIEAPAWDDDPALLTWDDCEALFHEIGHVLQFVLARSPQGCILGPEHMPLDLTEFLPKFMEHWLTEKTTLYALIDLSKRRVPLSDKSIDAAYRVRSRTKALKLAQQAFYGSLELELFSGFDLKGSETILDLQERLAKEFIPHDAPDEKDATPILDILQENAHGRNVGWYRYLWCDALSATAFEHFKDAYSKNPDSLPTLRDDFRRLLLEPGAAINVKKFRSEFSLDEWSPEALYKRYNF